MYQLPWRTIRLYIAGVVGIMALLRRKLQVNPLLLCPIPMFNLYCVLSSFSVFTSLALLVA